MLFPTVRATYVSTGNYRVIQYTTEYTRRTGQDSTLYKSYCKIAISSASGKSSHPGLPLVQPAGLRFPVSLSAEHIRHWNREAAGL